MKRTTVRGMFMTVSVVHNGTRRTYLKLTCTTDGVRLWNRCPSNIKQSKSLSIAKKRNLEIGNESPNLNLN